ncbi:hypothetical protein EJ05DRAFT_494110 [Pseudovirgaria hyperparasitica]|uniref:Myb-like domain-containing protein n=1 Tax=Pseudovirgaria hyperparasitica TaxID=470096 RepID=A0A6A6W049_9PEZI|nr:uncharacterized protein EJ05DRAFT_494110 [Pseudovirgaria hyperparasitica]KAF2754947.1 hypothetical protein EJ05DRAFT_494110 [Pseudovirgaria hyperparasitica]
MAQHHPPPQTQTHYGPVPQHQDYSTQQQRAKRPRSQDSLALQVEGMQGYTSNVSGQDAVELTPGGQLQTQGLHYGQQQTHHHHRMPGPPPAKISRGDYSGEPSSPSQIAGPPSVVGLEGMPDPAPRPRGPKLKFTPEDDQLLVDLKEKKSLTWKQIADFFPGRSSGTLQVRYCTKLKAKTTVWNDELVQKLRTAMTEYENDRWRIIATKVGNGFSPASCKDKASELLELEGLDEPQADDEEDQAEEQDEPEEYGVIETRT